MMRFPLSPFPLPTRPPLMGIGARFSHQRYRDASIRLPPWWGLTGRALTDVLNQQMPLPLDGGGRGGGETTARVPPIRTFPRQGGKEFELPSYGFLAFLLAPMFIGGEGFVGRVFEDLIP
jgi:hypothetical protein